MAARLVTCGEAIAGGGDEEDVGRALEGGEQAVAADVEDFAGGLLALGGAISGEHGIGLAKTPFLLIQHWVAQMRAMKAVKDALDPRGMLNPGKMFAVFRVWKHPRMDVHLPWDHK